ncbi:twin-arginine translocase subunit TatC [Halalkalibacter hemicellulosilyticus]|uniref:Sec-independent protein translocase protein TatC n=1 Tax=Halalkalibacter hemicellulosilyticusJCM 9152 TaxID=1236971 RepID=W4QD60_9BACI|nr:twin-arginine translocase subunit TatC [Halalkalibacter hemicellulosilyticus]GAE29970.1 twin-arginine translocation protein TatC [Halalkalibacter hemicellulosilyticusJCM 9152]
MEYAESMPIVDHLEELRRRIIAIGIAFVSVFLLSFFFVQDIYFYLIKDLEGKLTILSPIDVLWAYVMIATVVTLTVIVPFIGYHIWRYVAPGMSEKEKSAGIMYIPAFFFLFILGLLFGFYVIFPTVMSFFTSVADGQFEVMYTVDRYFKFMFSLTVPLALLFELPVVVLFLTKIGMISPAFLVKNRKYAYFILICLSVLVSPPDFLSDVLVIIPLLILYEVSVTISRFVYRKGN